MRWKKLPYFLNLRIRKLYTGIFNQLKPTLNIQWGWKKKKKYINEFFNSKKRENLAKKTAEEIAKIQVNNNKEEFRKLYYRRKSINLKLPPLPDVEKELLQKLVEQNYEMIKSIPKRVFGLNKLKYVQLIQKQVLEGSLERNKLENFLNNLGSKYSKTIARTEVSKLQTAVQEQRSKKLGCEMYVWSSTYDVRTRESHRKMNNVIVVWSQKEGEKPYLDKFEAHAGEFINCRCFPEPIFDERDLPKGSILKVWSPRFKKIIKVNRGEFIKKMWGESNE